MPNYGVAIMPKKSFPEQQDVIPIAIILLLVIAYPGYAKLTVISTSPTAGETGVVALKDSPEQPTGGFIEISITFNTEIDDKSVDVSAIKLYDDAEKEISGKISHDVNKLTFLPDVILDNGKNYVVTISREIKSLTGDVLPEDYAFSFKTKGRYEYYIYDKSIPLEPIELGTTGQLTYQEYKLTYASTNNVRVPALLCIPNVEAEKYPCLVFLHGFGGEKEDCREIAMIAAIYGYALLSIDAEYHGEREQSGKIIFAPNLVETRDAAVQTITDLRRGVDYLETLPLIDKTRIGYIGASMGAILGAVFTDVEPRIKGAVLIVGGGPLSLVFQQTSIPEVRAIEPTLTIPYDEAEKIIAPIDPINFIGEISPRPILMQNARFDEQVPPETGERLYAATGAPKWIDWYDDTHTLPKSRFDVVERVIDWLETYLFNPHPWDVNGDKQVGIADLILVGIHIGEKIESAKTPNPDVNLDGIVDITDLVLVGTHFGAIDEESSTRGRKSLTPLVEHPVAPVE